MVSHSDSSHSSLDSPSIAEAPILHVDLDAFFASVEVLDDPQLRGLPVAVGGAGPRGVIASASYEARRYGVRSAMASVVAQRLCPDLRILPGRFERYEEVSQTFRAIINDVTPNYEPIGLDEVFADLSSLTRLAVTPHAAAREIRERISYEMGLRCGIGIARNKLFAKLASRRAKPRVHNGELLEGVGILWVSAALEVQWLDEMNVSELWGVGPATSQKLRALGLSKVRDLARVEEHELRRHFGNSLGSVLANYARGEDQRRVASGRKNKSIGHDQTFAESLAGIDDVRAACRHHSGVVARALRDQNLMARTFNIVLRFDDLTSVSRSQTLPFGLDDEYGIAEVAMALCDTVEVRQSVRLLGLHASGLSNRDESEIQLTFDVGPRERITRTSAEDESRERQISREALRDALDEIRRRFGRSAVANASDLNQAGVRVDAQRSRAAFGPSGEGD